MVNKAEIRKTLKEYFTIDGKITIADDGRVSVKGDVALNLEHSHLPVQFDIVDGDVECHNTGLQSLKGSPTKISGFFYCEDNQLRNLEGGPEEVGSYFWCESNPLESLKGFPSYVGGTFYCDYNPSLPLLRTLVAKNGVYFQNKRKYPFAEKIKNVLNQFKGQGKAGVLKCSHALLTLEKELQETDPTISLRANVKW
jgi:hypothetical protein